MNNFNEGKFLLKRILNADIDAVAEISGKDNIQGQVSFYNFDNSTVVVAVLHNLPETNTNIFGFHIHEEGICEGDFSSAGPHFGEGDHPKHKGDMPVLFSGDGDAFLAFFTNRFSVDEVIGRSVIIHEQPDDYTTQPSGNSGARIACGIIEECKR